jgi:uncharacterized protein (TIGR02246 family)
MACEPVDVVQTQLEAYNKRDVAAFVATYAPDAAVYNHPGVLQMRGRAEMTKQYGAMFKAMPSGYAEVKNRIAVRDAVIDHEIAYEAKGEPLIEIAALYTVRNCLIQRVDFFPVPETAQ